MISRGKGFFLISQTSLDMGIYIKLSGNSIDLLFIYMYLWYKRKCVSVVTTADIFDRLTPH